jgi:hypothetical protein
MRSRALTAGAWTIGGFAVCLTVAAAQQPAQPAAPATAQPAAPATGRGGQAAAPAPVPGGLPPRPQTEADLLNDKGGIPEGFTSIFNGKDLTGWHVSKTNHHGTTPDYRVVHGMIVGNQNPIDKGGIPEGFTSIFNGKDLTGWHVSKTNHHGTTPDYRVVHGMIVGNQNPIDKGGILLTDKKYKNFEVYMEIKPDWGNDSGLFLRSSEAGEAYQITLDYLPGGSMGGIYGERLQGLSAAPPPPGVPVPTLLWTDVWRRESWNSVRARIEGDIPHIQVWINGAWIRDWRDTANHAAGGATDGMIAIQIHGGARALPGGFWRWRNLAVKELN